MKKLLSIILLVLAMSVGLCACGDNKEDEETVTDKDAHYICFMVENGELGQMLVLPTDTYDALSVYFPLIPEKEGYTSYWEEKEVYSESEKIIYINAYYVKVNE